MNAKLELINQHWMLFQILQISSTNTTKQAWTERQSQYVFNFSDLLILDNNAICHAQMWVHQEKIGDVILHLISQCRSQSNPLHWSCQLRRYWGSGYPWQMFAVVNVLRMYEATGSNRQKSKRNIISCFLLVLLITIIVVYQRM